MLFESFCFWEFKSLLTDGGVYFSRRHPRRGSRARRARQRVDRVFEVGEGALAGCGGGGKAAAPILLRCGYFDPADRFLQFMDQFAEESLVDTERLFQFRLGDATGSGAELECGEDDSGVMAEERRGATDCQAAHRFRKSSVPVFLLAAIGESVFRLVWIAQ